MIVVGACSSDRLSILVDVDFHRLLVNMLICPPPPSPLTVLAAALIVAVALLV